MSFALFIPKQFFQSAFFFLAKLKFILCCIYSISPLYKSSAEIKLNTFFDPAAVIPHPIVGSTSTHTNTYAHFHNADDSQWIIWDILPVLIGTSIMLSRYEQF